MNEDLIEMNSAIKVKILTSYLRRLNNSSYHYTNIASTGTAFMLLKKGAILRKEKAEPKRCSTRLKILLKEEEDKNDNE